MNKEQKQELRKVLLKILELVGPEVGHEVFGKIIVYTSGDYITIEKEELEVKCFQIYGGFFLKIEMGFKENYRVFGFQDFMSLVNKALVEVKKVGKARLEKMKMEKIKKLEEELKNLKEAK